MTQLGIKNLIVKCCMQCEIHSISGSVMLYFKFGIVGVCIVYLTGCAAPQNSRFPPAHDHVPISMIQIASRFDTMEITRENIVQEASKCVPKTNVDSQSIKRLLSDFPSKNIRAIGHVSTSRQFILQRTTAICLQRSTNKYPIFAAEAFIDTVNPRGVPPDVTDGWYKQLALLIATKGSAKVAYQFENGNAFIATYWVESNPAFGLFYTHVFKKAGEWETDNIDTKFLHASMSGVSEIKRSGASEKNYVLSHRNR